MTNKTKQIAQRIRTALRPTYHPVSQRELDRLHNQAHLMGTITRTF